MEFEVLGFDKERELERLHNIDWEQLKEQYSLEDWYDILEINEPIKNSEDYNTWNSLMNDTADELYKEDERPMECERLINDIIEFLKK